MKVAVAKYPIGSPRDFSEFAEKQRQLIAEAAQAGTMVAVMPEYLSLELAASFDIAISGDLSASLAAIQQYRQSWLDLYSQLAREYRLHLVAGSFLLAQGQSRYRNRSDWFTPEGAHGWQDKLQLTGFEKAAGVIEAGDALKVFEAQSVRVGISVCYDAEFPLPVRAQYESGARLLLVPSCTDTEAGATRVRTGCLARAMENRIFVAQSVTAGQASWSPALDANTGEAAIYAPMDAGFPADGIVVQSRVDRPEKVWAIAELDLEGLEASRVGAQVANDRDWNGQLAPGIARAKFSTV
jgi:predicted amidohydrolase